GNQSAAAEAAHGTDRGDKCEELISLCPQQKCAETAKGAKIVENESYFFFVVFATFAVLFLTWGRSDDVMIRHGLCHLALERFDLGIDRRVLLVDLREIGVGRVVGVGVALGGK